MTTTITLSPAQLDQQSINTIRFLAVDAVQKANSGHPGLPLGAAPSVANVSRQLEDEGVEKFNKPFDKLMATLAQRSLPRLTRAS